MKRSLLLAAAALAALTLVAAGCGDSDEIPADAVAVVDGTTITEASLDELLARAKKSYTAQKRAFPKAGTAEYQSLQTQAVAFLVQREEYAREADQLGIEVTDAQIAKKLDEVRKQYFGDDQKKFEKGLKNQGYTVATLREDIRSQLVTEAIYEQGHRTTSRSRTPTSRATTTRTATTTPSRSRAPSGTSSSRRRRRRTSSTPSSSSGADFAALAKASSLDPGSKDQGGKLTVARGQTVAPFDKAAFSLKTNELSQPVKTEFGYHLIQPLADVKPGSVTPFAQVKAQIKTQLESERKNNAVNDWVADVQKEYEDKVQYAAGLRAARHVDDRRDDDLGRVAAGVGDDAPLAELWELTRRLRAECPWDREQTARTIVPHTVEEAYEVADAALADDPAKLHDELGDLLFQVYFLSLLLEEQGDGDLDSVARSVHAKLVRRHPHVFGDAEARTAGRVRERWEAIKTEREGRSGVFHDVPESLPALLLARKAQRRAAAVGYDWPDLDGPSAKVNEELEELLAELVVPVVPAPETEPDRAVEAEVGDLLFTVVNLARFVNVDPELALRASDEPVRRARGAGRAARRGGGGDVDGARPRRPGALVRAGEGGCALARDR